MLKTMFIPATELKKELSLPASVETIRRRLRDNNLNAYSPRKVPLLSRRHVEKRLEFARTHLELPTEKWSNILWTDKSKVVCKSEDPLMLKFPTKPIKHGRGNLFTKNHMNAMNMQMRSMNRLMNSFMPDPFNMLTSMDGGFQQNALMERQNPHPMGGLFGFPAMPNMNRLLSADIGNNGAGFCSSSVITMSSGPDGRPQIYQATSSTKTGPGGIRETRRTVQDSVNGVKKMAIGHHIGERAHIIEKEQDLRSGQLEEHQEFINLEEDEAEDFDREFVSKAHGPSGRGGARAICAAPVPQQSLTIEEIDDDDDDVIETVPHVQKLSSSSSQNRRHLPAIPPASTQTHQNSVHPHPYNTSAARRSHHHHHHHQHRPKQHASNKHHPTTSTSANSNNQKTTGTSSQPRGEDNNSK